MSYLFDTDVVIDFIHEDGEAVKTVKELMPEGIAFSAVSLAECLCGVYAGSSGEKERAQLQKFLQESGATILPVDEAIADQYGKIQAELMKRGGRGGLFDTLIAATAMAHGLTLVTGNAKDFKKIVGLKVYHGAV